MNRFFKIAIGTGLSGLLIFVILILTQSVYSGIIKIWGSIALSLVYISIIFFIIAFILDFKDAVKIKNYLGALITAILFLLIFYPLIMNFFK